MMAEEALNGDDAVECLVEECNHAHTVYCVGQSELKGEDVYFVEHRRPWPGSDLTEHSMISNSSLQSSGSLAELADLDSAQSSRWVAQEFPPSCPKCGTSTNTFSLWCVFDGHNGAHAAKMAGDAVLPLVESRLPLGCPPPTTHPLYTQWRESIQRALVESTVELNSLFGQRGIYAGSTCTIVLQHEWLLTAVNLGDSRAVLDTGSEVISLSADHRVATHKGERRRVEAMGGVVAPIAMSGSGPANDYSSGVGPLRIWPGGLAISRAIGDFDVGEAVLPFPHLTQVMVPPGGGRLLVGSDGIWDAFDKLTRAGSMSRGWSTDTAPSKMIQTIVRAYGGLKDDTTLIVVDILPQGGDITFPQVASSAKRGGGPSSTGGASANGGGGGGGGGGFCACFGGSPTADSHAAGGAAIADISVNPSVRSMSSANSSVHAGNKHKTIVLASVDVAGIMGLMPEPELTAPGWYSPPIGEILFRAAIEASDGWREANSKRYARPPATPAMPTLERPSRRGSSGRRKVAFAKEAMERKNREASENGGPKLPRPASMHFSEAIAEGEEDYASRFGHYKVSEASGSGWEPSVRAGRVYNSDASVRAGNASGKAKDDPSVHLSGNALNDGSVHMKASQIESHEVSGLAPVRVVKRGGPQSRPVDVPTANKSVSGTQDSAKEMQSLHSIGE